MIQAYAEIAHVFPWFYPVVAFVFGACIGSFLNVVIYRVPAGESVVRPGSHCGCGQPIAWYDNIPIFSWIMLRGKARCCGRPFSFRYPAIELATGALFVLAWLHLPPAVAVCGWVFISCLICATFIDLDHMIIPDAFTIGLGCFGVILSVLVPQLHVAASGNFIVDSFRSGTAAIEGLLIGSGLVLWIGLLAEVILKKEAMGFGDVKFVGAIGAFCGWKGAIISIFGGAVVGSVWFAIALLIQSVAGKPSAVAPPSETPEGEAAPLGFGMHVPFGPMLAIAAGIYFLFLHTWFDAWFLQVSELF
jgi:leader peptidase (prepilin peptidase)/N-methyltransferase